MIDFLAALGPTDKFALLSLGLLVLWGLLLKLGDN